MKIQTIYIMALAAVLLTGCSDDADSQAAIDDAATVTVGVQLGMPTRAVFSLAVPNQTNPLSAHLWASTASTSYPDGDKDGTIEKGYEVGKHVEVTFYSGFAQVPKVEMRFPFTIDGCP